jgi:hypothetical protein
MRQNLSKNAELLVLRQENIVGADRWRGYATRPLIGRG